MLQNSSWYTGAKDSPRSSTINCYHSFLRGDSGQVGMWGISIKMRRREPERTRRGFKVLHLLKVGYQTSQAEILARCKIRKIWWYDFPSFLCRYKEDLRRILITMKCKEKSWDWNLPLSPSTNIKSRPVKYNTNETHKTFNLFWSFLLGILEIIWSEIKLLIFLNVNL